MWALTHVGSTPTSGTSTSEISRGVHGRLRVQSAAFVYQGTRGMDERIPTWSAQAAIGVLVGLGLGIAIGWWLWPVTYTNTSPATLHQDYQDEYVLMIAASYEVEQDIDEARSQLQLLNPAKPAAPVIELAERLRAEGGSKEDIVRVARLAQALGAGDPTATPDLEDRG